MFPQKWRSQTVNSSRHQRKVLDAFWFDYVAPNVDDELIWKIGEDRHSEDVSMLGLLSPALIRLSSILRSNSPFAHPQGMIIGHFL